MNATSDWRWSDQNLFSCAASWREQTGWNLIMDDNYQQPPVSRLHAVGCVGPFSSMNDEIPLAPLISRGP